MGLLNISKMKKTEEQPKANVPDELPSLPSKQPAGPNPTAAPGGPTPPLAPNEIPPLKPAAVPSAKPQPAATAPLPIETVIPQALAPASTPASSAPIASDERLYFSELISRFTNKEMREKAELELLSSSTAEVIETMHTQWESHKQLQQLQQYERMIEGHIMPLRQLEHDWRVLRDEIDEKKLTLQEKEFAIQQMTAELKRLIDAKNKIKEQMQRFGN